MHSLGYGEIALDEIGVVRLGFCIFCYVKVVATGRVKYGLYFRGAIDVDGTQRFRIDYPVAQILKIVYLLVCKTIRHLEPDNFSAWAMNQRFAGVWRGHSDRHDIVTFFRARNRLRKNERGERQTTEKYQCLHVLSA